MTAHSWWPLLLSCSFLAVGCAGPDSSTVVINGSTETGLLSIAKAKDTARVGVVRGQGTSAFFSNEFIPRSGYSVPMSGQVWVARGSLQITFVDRDGKQHAITATPEAPGQWSATPVRLSRPNQGNNGFRLEIVPLEGVPPQADGVVVEVVYSAT